MARNLLLQGFRRTWTKNEIEWLRQNYPDTNLSFVGICHVLERSRGAVASQAPKLGLERPKRDIKPWRPGADQHA